MTDQIHELGRQFIFILLLVLVVVYFTRRSKYFKLPEEVNFAPVTLIQVIGAFAIFLFLQIAMGVLAFILVRHVDDKLALLGWLQVTILITIFLSVLIYCRLLNPRTRNGLFWGGQGLNKRAIFVNGFKKGIVTLFIAYPFVVLAGLIASVISLLAWGKKGVQQDAVEHLKMTKHHPWLYFLMVFTVAFLVPIVEEILFRGFLQSWLKKGFGRAIAIPLTALIFSFAHFSKNQGIGNFELLISLFTLSLFIGFIYEKERTIWAPIGVHMGFNTLSVIFITFFK